jgi:hypothetical protein
MTKTNTTATPRLEQTTADETPGTAAERPTTAAPDPFDVGSLRLSQDFEAGVPVERQLVRIPIHRPRRQDFIRVNPDPGFRVDTTVLEVKDAGETYLVPPAFRAALAQELVAVRLYTAITRQGLVLCHRGYAG